MEAWRIACGLVALLGACARASEPWTWVADRAAHELVALDGELCVTERIALTSPRLVLAAPGALWVAAGRLSGARAPGKLVRLEPASGARAETDFQALLALCAGPDGAVLVLEDVGAGEAFLWRVAPDLSRTLLGAFPGARALAARAGEILVACAGGELVLLDPSGAVLALGAGPAEPLALAPGPRAGEWWLLDGHPAGLGLLGPQLATRWSVRTQLAATSLAPVPGRERVWLAAGASAQLFGAGGALELALELAGGPWCAASATDEGVRLLGIGAVLELETWGNQARIARTQGGFEGLASPAGEVSVPAAATPPPAGSSRRSRPRAPSRSAGSAPRAPRPRRVARAPPRARAPRTGGCARSRSRAPAGT